MKKYILRTCAKDMTSHRGFPWPESGEVSAPDWDPAPRCGGGLHGLLMGKGDGSLLDWDPAARWLVAEIDEYVDLGGKVKAPRAWVRHVGDRRGATDWLIAHGADASRVVGAFVIGGDGATVTGGHRATVTGGYGATVTGGYGATVTGGHGATVTGGDGATVTGGDRATVTGGHGATVTGGYGATVTGSDRATLIVRWHDGTRRRVAVAYVGEGGIAAGVAYKFDGARWVKQ